jgi:predicted transcriptional regulator
MYMDILDVINEGENIPTRIMHSANLSWKPLQKMLNSLVSQELIVETEENHDRRTKKSYFITEKGESTLDFFNRAINVLEIE